MHRYAMAAPACVRRLVAASAGWYTMPEPLLAYPMGTAPSRDLPGGMRHLDAFFGIPTRVLVGERDIERDAMLRVSPQLDEWQGRHRVERGRRWVRAMSEAAKRAGVTADVALELMPGTGHSARQAIARGGLVPRALSFLVSGER